MLVIQVIVFLFFFMFIVSIGMLGSAVRASGNKRMYISAVSFVYIIYLICLLALDLDLSFGLELLFYRGISFIAIILFICSIVISSKNTNEISGSENSKSEIILPVLIVFPVFLFSFSYFREENYINKSKLVLIFSEGEMFNERDYAYAINDNYCEEVSIGVDFKGYEMKKYLPKGFKKVNYTWSTDRIEVDNNKITIFSENKLLYEGKLNCKISDDVETIFYK